MMEMAKTAARSAIIEGTPTTSTPRSPLASPAGVTGRTIPSATYIGTNTRTIVRGNILRAAMLPPIEMAMMTMAKTAATPTARTRRTGTAAATNMSTAAGDATAVPAAAPGAERVPEVSFYPKYFLAMFI